MYRFFLKRLIDLLLAIFLLSVLSPVFLSVLVLLSWSNRGSPFFVQPRIGYKNSRFLVVKFKTMNDKKDANGALLSDEIRLTKIGQVIRSLSLDELPQLLNVIYGNMSLIGPRPLLVEYLERYDEVQITRHQVRPGISGWAQVNGRNAVSWQRKFELDVYYVQHISFWLDLKIFFLTIRNVILREGISAENSATTEKFMGN